LRPAPGIEQQASYLHEAGHALHDALTQEKRFELTKLGTITVSEVFALLFEDLTQDSAWLHDQTPLNGERESTYLAVSAAYRLYLLRRAAGRLLFEVQLHHDPKQDPAELYRTVMSRTYQLPLGNEDIAHARVEQEDFYASADTFRAWFLAAQLEAQLKTRFGDAWWKRAESGALLKQLWAPGNGATPEELAAMWGDTGLEGGIRPEALLMRLGAAPLKH
jgi:hypothetical protein